MEQIFFDEQEVLITDKRFVTGTVVFPIDKIGSIRLDKKLIQPKAASWPIILLAVALLFLIIAGWYLYAVLDFLIWVAYLYYWRKVTTPIELYSIYVTTSGSDKEGVQSYDLVFIQKIFNVLNDVLVRR